MLRSFWFLLREGITKPYQVRIRHLSELSSSAKGSFGRNLTYLFLSILVFFVACLKVSFSFIRITAVPRKTPQPFLGWWVGLGPKERGPREKERQKREEEHVPVSLAYLSFP